MEIKNSKISKSEIYKTWRENRENTPDIYYPNKLILTIQYHNKGSTTF